jgi:hypothetical protein
LANAKNGKDCAQRAFDAKSRMVARIDLILRIYHILGGFLWGRGLVYVTMGKRFALFGNRNIYKSSMALAFMISPLILSV